MQPTKRIIPARAGFTSQEAPTCHSIADHPRSRGVYENLPLLMKWKLGSSPLARGLHKLGLTIAAVHRIIPARAGFTANYGPGNEPGSDHPRSRGVYSLKV